MTKNEIINEIKSVVMNNGGYVNLGWVTIIVNNGEVFRTLHGYSKNVKYEKVAQIQIYLDCLNDMEAKTVETKVENTENTVEVEKNDNNVENMTKNEIMKEEKIASKLEDFLLDFDYLEGFTTYRAYCYVFDLDYDWNIHYDEHNRVNSKEMSFDDFGTWLMFYMFDNKREDFIGVDIAECNDCVYTRK